MQPLDDALFEENRSFEEPVYANTFKRLLAFLIDALLIKAFTMLLNVVSSFEGFLFLLYILLCMLAGSYKFFMEYQYGFTIGKRIFNLKVVSLDLETMSLKQALLRNCIPVVTQLVICGRLLHEFYITYITSTSSQIDLFGFQIPDQTISILAGFCMIVNGIVLLYDLKNRRLLDKLAGTIVVQQR